MGIFRPFIDDANRVGGVVAANVKEIADIMGPHDFKHGVAILLIRFIACRQ